MRMDWRTVALPPTPKRFADGVGNRPGNRENVCAFSPCRRASGFSLLSPRRCCPASSPRSESADTPIGFVKGHTSLEARTALFPVTIAVPLALTTCPACACDTASFRQPLLHYAE